MSLTISEANQRVDELVQVFYTHLKNDERLNVSEIVKSGSLGHGTAIQGDYDLDLVLYSRNIDPDIVVEMGNSHLLDRMDRFLRRRLQNEYQFVRKTSFSIQFKFHNEIDVDLLLSPYWEKPEELHLYLLDLKQSDKMKFYCSAAKWQVKFFQKQPNEVKEYIKRFKKWRNMYWPKGKDAIGRPKSFLLSLLMVEAYKRSADKSVVSIERELKKMVKQHRDLYIKWNDEGYYDHTFRLTRSEIKSLVAKGRFTLISSNEMTGEDIVYDNIFKKRRHYTSVEMPNIADVANPFNNVYKSGVGNYFSKDPDCSYHPGTANWNNFAMQIDTFHLDQPIK